MFENLKCDLKRYNSKKGLKAVFYRLFEQGLWAIVVYRFGQWVRKIKIPIISFFAKLLAFILYKFIELITGISLPASAKIGKGFFVGHFGPTIVHSYAVIGENCTIGPNVVIGTRGKGKNTAPTLGNGVYVGAGCKVLGSIKIGDDAKLGANAVVIKDVPSRATVVGVPGKVVKIRKRKKKKGNHLKNWLVFWELPLWEFPILEYSFILPL